MDSNAKEGIDAYRFLFLFRSSKCILFLVRLVSCSLLSKNFSLFILFQASSLTFADPTHLDDKCKSGIYTMLRGELVVLVAVATAVVIVTMFVCRQTVRFSLFSVCMNLS